jgi:hypothetical protein
MKTRFFSLLFVGLFVSVGLSAQTKASGKCTCKGDPPAPVALTDQPNHAFMIGKATCTWSGWTMGGTAAKDGVSTDLAEMLGDTTTLRGYHVGKDASGDTWTAKYEGTGKSKDGKPVSSEGTWVFSSGTGKYKGIKGKGTFKGGAPNADGSTTYQVDGEYQLP